MIAEGYRYYRGGKDCYEAVELVEQFRIGEEVGNV